MSNESFWKTVKNKLWPTDNEPPVWAIFIVIILVGGVALWLFGLPWQVDIPVTLLLLLFAVGGQQLGKRLRKENEVFKDPDEVYSNKVARGWAIGAILNSIIVLFVGFCYKYSLPMWTLFIPAILAGLEATLYFYLKRPKKTYEKRQK